MISNFTTFTNVDYWASDLCQIGYRDTLLDFWRSIKLFDGSWNPIPESILQQITSLKGKRIYVHGLKLLKNIFMLKIIIMIFK